MATWPASSHGSRRGIGVSIVPIRIRSVRIATAVSATQASMPQTGSHTKNASQPCSSATAARSAAVRASPYGSTHP